MACVLLACVLVACGACRGATKDEGARGDESAARARPATIGAPVAAPAIPPAGDAWPTGAEAVSLLGKPLVSPAPAAKDKARLEANLVEAQVWHARRLGYLGRYQDAIEVLTRALAEHPDEPRLLRHRGHRYLTTRRLDLAIADFERAAAAVAGQPDEIEPDGIPSQWPPHSTLQGNIHYHLALARHVRGDHDDAVAGWRRCLELATNDESRVSATYWLQMSLRELGRHDEADAACRALADDLVIHENKSYWLLVRAYDGRLSPTEVRANQPAGRAIEDATTGFGLANLERLARRRREGAGAAWATEEERRRLMEVVEGTPWSAFGNLAAEGVMSRCWPR